MGRGSGGRIGGSRSASFNVGYNFNLFTQDDSGNFRRDVEGDLTNKIGIFPGAIENFELRLNESVDFFLFDGDDAVNIGSNESDNVPAVPSEFSENLTLDLTARLIPVGQTISLPDGREPVFPSRDPSLTIEDSVNSATPNVTNASRIEYTLTSNELASVGIDEITLVLRDSSGTFNNANLGSLDLQRAVNDIDYIIEQNLLGNIVDIRVSGPSRIDPLILISLEGNTADPSIGSGSDGSSFTPIAPNAVGDSVETPVNTTIPIDVLMNDRAETGDIVGIIDTFDAISTSGGSVVLLNGGILEYTPAAGFVGQDAFEYTISSFNAPSATATVTVNVTEDVDAIDDSANTEENTAVSIDVLANDSGNGTLSSFNSTSASGGSVVQNGNLLEYTPANDFTGQDTFTYTIDNNGVQDTATVTVDVTETPLLNGDDVISGDNGNNIIDGGEGNNILYGFDGDDFLQTGSGSDNLQGNNGNDTLNAGGGNDIITGGDGNDIIDGGDGNDTIDAGSQDDNVFGGSGDDLINGGNGNDTLNGGAGNDVLVGDGGSDIFVLNALGGNDTIRDFNFDHDTIGLSDGITFDQITITQGNGAALVNFNSQTIGSISGGTPNQFDASKFIAV